MIVRRLARLLLHLFYRSVTVQNPDRVPRGPLVVCANHHGSLIDPLILLAAIDRPLRPLAKAPLFRHPILRIFLRWVRAVPVYRPQDRHLVSGSNADLYRASAEALAAGGALLIFPEGISKPKPVLSPLKPGAARIALAAEERNGWSDETTLLPVAIHSEQAHSYRRGRVVAEIGTPIHVADYQSVWRKNPEAAVTALTLKLTTSLREMLIEGDSSEELHLLRTAMRCWLRDRGEAADAVREIELARGFANAHRRLQLEAPGELETLRESTEAYARTLTAFQLTGGELDVRYRLLPFVRFFAVDGLALLALAPLGCAGILTHYLPFRVASVIAARMSEEEDSWASLQLAVAVAVFPGYWLAVAIAAALWQGGDAFVIVASGLPLLAVSGWLFTNYTARFRHRARAFLLLAGGGGLARHLRKSRRAIHDQVQHLSEVIATAPKPAAGPDTTTPASVIPNDPLV